MIKANVILDYSKWKNKIKNPDNYLKKKIKKLSKIPYFKRKKQEFSILLTNNKKMKNLNLKFRKKNKPTDVLSFRLKNKNYIGDIAISFEIKYPNPNIHPILKDVHFPFSWFFIR